MSFVSSPTSRGLSVTIVPQKFTMTAVPSGAMVTGWQTSLSECVLPLRQRLRVDSDAVEVFHLVDVLLAFHPDLQRVRPCLSVIVITMHIIGGFFYSVACGSRYSLFLHASYKVVFCLCQLAVFLPSVRVVHAAEIGILCRVLIMVADAGDERPCLQFIVTP